MQFLSLFLLGILGSSFDQAMLRLTLLFVTISCAAAQLRYGSRNSPNLNTGSASGSGSFPTFGDAEKNITFVVKAKDIPNKGFVSNVDPYLKIYYTNKSQIEPVKFATTEVVKDDANPEFTTVIPFTWNRGELQKIIFRVKDNNRLMDETLGEATIKVDDLAMKNEPINVTLSNGGSLLIRKTTPVRFRLYARTLPRKDPFHGKSDPFVKAYWKRGSNGKEIKFFQTAHKNDLENVDWDEIIEFPNYIQGDDLWWVFKVRDYDGIGSDDDLGEAQVEIDPYVAKRQTKKVRLGQSGSAELYINPM